MNTQAAFDILALELTIYASLLGFLSIMFIFWYREMKERQKTFFIKLTILGYSIFVMGGCMGIFLGVWILSLFSAYPGSLSEIYLPGEVGNYLLSLTSFFSFWIFFTMLYIVIGLLPTIWPKIELSKRKRGEKMRENDCFFYPEIDGNYECIIFKKDCSGNQLKKCDWYQKKTSTYPDGMKSYMPYVNFISQARFIESQKFHNKLIMGLSIILTIISSIALLKSFNVF